MSHVDEGTLHAYLDGELTLVERERVDTHVRGCPACQARLAEERAIIERASRLLGLATPPERAMPPLHQLRQARRGWRYRRPLVWAATLILAVGLGWYARGRSGPRGEAESDRVQALTNPSAPGLAAATPDTRLLAKHPLSSLAARSGARRMDSVSKDRDADHQLADLRAAAGAESNALQAQESAAAATVAEAVTRDSVERKTDAGAVMIRGRPAAAPAVAEPRAAPNLYVDRAPARQRATPIMSTSWPLIARNPARDVLGVEPVIVPGFAVRGYRHNPGAQEIAVEQVTDAGTTITLIERRVDTSADELRRADSAAANAPRAMAKAGLNERLARFVGPLRVEIEGPLTPDSLSSLLELVR